MNGNSLKELGRKVKEDFELKEKSKLINFLVDNKIKEIEKKSILLDTKENILNNFLKFIKINNLFEIQIAGRVYTTLIDISFIFQPEILYLKKEEEFSRIPCLTETKITEIPIFEFEWELFPKFCVESTCVHQNDFLSVFNNKFEHPRCVIVYPYQE